MPALPKPTATRQRRNKPPVSPATLIVEALGELPNLPRREPGQMPWHKATRVMWRAVQRSPMVAEYLPADLPQLFIVAELYDQYCHTGDVKYAAELRHHRQYFGLTPLDRRRLQWEVQKVEKGERGNARPAEDRSRTQGDARAMLHSLAS